MSETEWYADVTVTVLIVGFFVFMAYYIYMDIKLTKEAWDEDMIYQDTTSTEAKINATIYKTTWRRYRNRHIVERARDKDGNISWIDTETKEVVKIYIPKDELEPIDRDPKEAAIRLGFKAYYRGLDGRCSFDFFRGPNYDIKDLQDVETDKPIETVFDVEYQGITGGGNPLHAKFYKCILGPDPLGIRDVAIKHKTRIPLSEYLLYTPNIHDTRDKYLKYRDLTCYFDPKMFDTVDKFDAYRPYYKIELNKPLYVQYILDICFRTTLKEDIEDMVTYVEIEKEVITEVKGEEFYNKLLERLKERSEKAKKTSPGSITYKYDRHRWINEDYSLV